jgi:hypothetical protein
VKVVILGQDPYFNENQAHGLAFSVSKGVAVPPSLKKIYAELERSIPGFKRPTHGCLTEWAQRGVFLLNATYASPFPPTDDSAVCSCHPPTHALVGLPCVPAKPTRTPSSDGKLSRMK